MGNGGHQKKRLFSSSYILLLSIEAIFQFATYMLNPVISSYVIVLGASLTIAGFVAGLVATSALAARPFVGWFSDRISKTTLLIISAAMFSAAAFGCALSNSVLIIGMCRIIQGIAFALRSAVVVSLVSFVVPKKSIGQAVGWVGVTTTISCAIAPLLASYFGSYFGFRTCFIVAALLFLVGFVLSLKCKFSSDIAIAERAAKQSLDEANSRSGDCSAGRSMTVLRSFLYFPALPYSLIAALSGVPHGINVSLILLVGESRALPQISLYFAAYAFAALVSRPVAGRLCDTKGFNYVIMPSLLVDLAGVASLCLMQTIMGVIVSGILVGVGQGSAYSSLQAEVARRAPAAHMGKAANTFYVGPDINMGLTPVVAGYVMSKYGDVVMYCICFAVVLLSLVLCLVLRSNNHSCR